MPIGRVARRAVGDEEADVLGRVAGRVADGDVDGADVDRVAVADAAARRHPIANAYCQSRPPLPDRISSALVRRASSRAPDTKSAWMCVSVTCVIESFFGFGELDVLLDVTIGVDDDGVARLLRSR